MSEKNNSFMNFWRAVAWTVVYVFIMWAILRGLFGFNMFSIAHLTKLWNLQLHGFAGLVFGILVLAAIPLYVATTVLTVRNQEMPVKIPLPKCLTEGRPVPEPQKVVPVVEMRETLPPLPVGVPQELRESFMRAKKNYGARQMSVFNRPNAPLDSSAPGATLTPMSEPVTESAAVPQIEDTSAYGGMPIPTDFDIDAPMDSEQSNDVPVFADINFGDDKDDVKSTSNTSAPVSESGVAKYRDSLRDARIEATTNGDLIVANGFVIAVHDDEDFWVTDEVDWFAAGKQKPSPIAALKKAQSEQSLKPVLYLVTDSIMDLDKVVAEWTTDGITVVKDKDELVRVLKSA